VGSESFGAGRLVSRLTCALEPHADITGIADLKIPFEKGTPFHPFEQLMGVLPAGSKSFVPPAFRELMTDPVSPIIDFYPEEFELDMNGKKADWEAVVKIPFIDENRLLAAMKSGWAFFWCWWPVSPIFPRLPIARESGLTRDERARNAFGQSYSFTYDPKYSYDFPSSLPGIFPGG
jgi:5'-3' exoribonuclease 1